MNEKIKYVDEQGNPFTLFFNKVQYCDEIKRLMDKETIVHFIEDYCFDTDYDKEDLDDIVQSITTFSQLDNDFWLQKLKDMPRKKNGTLYNGCVCLLWSHDTLSAPDAEINNLRKYFIRIKATSDSTAVLQTDVYNVPY